MRTPWRYLTDKVVERNLQNDSNWLLKAISATTNTAAGARVDPDKAMQVAAVYASIKVLAETIASLPLQLFKREGDNKTPATDHPLYKLFSDGPNQYQTAYELRENLVSNVNYWGNAYYQKIYRAGEVNELHPLSPDQMSVSRRGGKLAYEYSEGPKPRAFRADKVWHIKNLSLKASYNDDTPEGVLGISPISVARETIGSAMAADEYAARYFSNNASVGLHAAHPGRLSENGKEFLKKSLEEYGKLENKFKSIVTEEGLEIKNLGMTNEDSQFLETRNFSVEEIARIFRVPAILIGHPDKTMTYASAEQMFLAFATHTIRPWCVRLEQSMNRYLISDEDRETYFFEHNLAALLRGDTTARYEAYSKARQWGWMSVNEIRALENMNAIDEGDVYLEPSNMNAPGEGPDTAPMEEEDATE